MLPWSGELAGRLDELTIDSAALRDNPLDDPHERPLWVQVPPGYDDDPGRRYPSVYMIQGYTGHLAMWRNRTPYRQPFVETADAVLADRAVPPVIVVYVDAWTAYGGSQFVDSPGTGQYHSYLCDDVVPFVDERYRTIADRDHRAIAGKSSGGFGAMITPMLRPDLFGALATHAGDALYEHLYIPEFAKVVRHLRDYDGDVWAWWADFRSRVAFTKESDDTVLMTLGVAACFSADDDGTVRLPFDTRSGRAHRRPLAALDGVGPCAHAGAARVRRSDALHAGHLDRRRDTRPVVSRPRREGLPRRTTSNRRRQGSHLLRALRRHALGDRVPLPDVVALARRAPR